MATWQPSNEGLAQLVALIRDSESTVPGVQQRVHAQLQSYNNIPDYNNYLCYIFTKLRNEPEFVRTVSGILLKNNVRDYYAKMPAEVQHYIKQEVLSVVNDPSANVRRTLGSIVTQVVLRGRVEGWPGLIQHLVGLLDNSDPNVVDCALNTIFLVCEDSGGKLDSEQAGRPLNVLIPKLLQMFRAPNERWRHLALSSLNQFIVDMPAALLVNMDAYLQGIFFLASDTFAQVRRKVCAALITLLDVKQEFLIPHIRNVVQYMLHCSRDTDPSVALEACEFWSAIADTSICRQVLQEFLPTLIPLLLGGMVYAEDDSEVDEGEDEMTPDRPQDIRPRFHVSKSNLGAATAATSQPSTAGAGADGAGDGDGGGSDSESDDDYNPNDEEAPEWNLRKCSAAGLDILSGVFKDDILAVLLPLITERIGVADPARWKLRESGILAIGAVAEGCINGMRQYLPNVVPYLITLLDTSQTVAPPLVRSITCWTLSRYARWIVAQQTPDTYLKPLMMHLLNSILDRNKKVQEAACSAFATLEEEAQDQLVPYLLPILQTLSRAFEKYQAKNLLILYDAVGTLADSVGQELNKAEYINVLMPPLIAKWNVLADNDRNLFPLLECLTSVSTALSVGFQSFAPPVFQRCLKLIENTVVQQALYLQQPEHVEAPDKEFMVCALDLISGLAEGLGPAVESLVANSTLPALLFECMKDKGPDVRQSAFALVGDLAKTCILHLRPMLPQYIPVLTNNLYPDFISVCNNAAWALGEIAIKIGEEMKPFVPPIVQRLVPIMNRINLNRNLLENTAITLGRLGLVAPELVAPHLEEFVQSWCISLRNIRDDIEKDSAFRGMCVMIRANPSGVLQHFVYICDAIASWFYPKQDLKEQFHQILHSFKSHMGDAWPQYYAGFPELLRQTLSERYQL